MFSNRWKLFRKFFVGNTLAEEFGFANYFHFSSITKALHLFFPIFGPVLIFNVLTYYFNYTVGFVFLSFYSFTMSFLCMVPALIYLVLWLGIVFLINQQYLSIFISNPPLSSISVLFTMLFGFFGHILIERSFPAFRLFEAVIVTPVLILLWVLKNLGIYKDFWEEIEKETPKFKGSIYERRINCLNN